MIELEFGDLTDDAGHDLDGAGTGADDRDPLAGEVDGMVPLRGMESGALEFSQSLDVGKSWNVQRAGA